MIETEARAILWLAIEDFAGLWEVVWQLRSITPEAQEPELRESARRIVSDLLRRGWVNLYECQEPYGEMRKVPSADAAGLLARETYWSEPAADAVSIRVGATTSGEAAFAQ
ncbi:MAG TPA: hypothetical protein VFX70_15575 [Mycobacteriales bacterium]|nr:hypothetical protein [Mycobacteriales bacterium]